MKELLQLFLEDEVSDQEYYDGIIDFICSGNIRRGEYEGNLFVIKKMDQSNFILFTEYEIEGKKEIHSSFTIPKNKLLSAIHRHAKELRFQFRENNR